MREIIFRGKSKRNGQWEYGSYIHQTEYFDDFGYTAECHYIVECCPAKFNFKMMSFLPIDFETVGQYTGFDDKNGKKVFEGDILKAEIWWEQGGCYPHTETRFIEATFPNMYKNHFEKFEVVGNIYDNPELLRR